MAQLVLKSFMLILMSIMLKQNNKRDTAKLIVELVFNALFCHSFKVDRYISLYVHMYGLTSALHISIHYLT